MPNIYATPTEIKAAAPNIIQSTTTTYDDLILRLAHTVSRQIDAITGKHFYPVSAVKYFTPETESSRLRVPSLVSFSAVAYTPDGSNYTNISTAYVVGEVEQDRNGGESYTHLRLTWNSTPGTFPAIQDGARVTGIWSYVDDRDACWELAGTLSSGVGSTSATLKIGSGATSDDIWGWGTAFQIGRVLKVGSEFFEVTAVTNSTGVDSLTVLRARNGTTAASHSTGVSIYIWRPAELVHQACIIEAVKLLERGLQAFANARATPEMGQPIWEKKLDVQTVKMLEPLMEF